MQAEENLAQTKADKLVEREVQRLIAMRKRAKAADKKLEHELVEQERSVHAGWQQWTNDELKTAGCQKRQKLIANV